MAQLAGYLFTAQNAVRMNKAQSGELDMTLILAYGISLILIFLLVPVFFRRLLLKWRLLIQASMVAVATVGFFYGASYYGRLALEKARGYPLQGKVARPYQSRPLQFEGDSSKLQRTQIVPTLDWPIEPGKNVIWCASYQASWKRLQSDLAKEPVSLPGAEQFCAALNASPVPEVPEGELYAVAGWENQGILDEIRREKARLFPGSIVPQFPDIAPGSFVAYAYLQSACKFTLPYFDSDRPLEFTDSTGKKTSIRTFGIRPEDEDSYYELRQQVEFLFAEREGPELREFGLDLCRDSSPAQLVFARITPGKSLQEMLSSLEAKIEELRRLKKEHNVTTSSGGIGPSDVLLVPDIAYRLVHRFAEIQGKVFGNQALAGQRFDVAQQEIQFRLDRSGAELASEAKNYATPIPAFFMADRPFLIYLKKRGASSPYFVMWVDNDELLTKWPDKK